MNDRWLNARSLAVLDPEMPARKQNVPPGKAALERLSYRRAFTVNTRYGPFLMDKKASGQAGAGQMPRGRTKSEFICFPSRTCGRAGAESCAGVTPYCSLWAVRYDISCGSLNFEFLRYGLTLVALVRRARAKGFCQQGFCAFKRDAALKNAGAVEKGTVR